jgi:uncharacterized protein
MKKIKYGFVFLVFFLNVVAAFHAYHFTHFTDSNATKTKRPSEQTVMDKLKTVVFGVTNPRPSNLIAPSGKYETVVLDGENGKLSCWVLPADSAQTERGTVAFFHGFGGAKSSLLERAYLLQKAGFRTVLLDFQGCGDSEGNMTTIGFREANDVKTVYQYLIQQKTENIILLGNSMGAAAIMKAIADNLALIKPKALVLECPFAEMQRTVSARFETMGVPAFPMAHLLLFWGSVPNGFWGFAHNPIEYAKNINTPTLLLYGANDETVNASERQTIFKNLANQKKQYNEYADTKHHELFSKNSLVWQNNVLLFLKDNL